MWVDSHCHLQERYRREEATDVVGALQRAAAAQVTAVVCIGTDLETSIEALDLASEVRSGQLGAGLPEVLAVVGLHPHEASRGTAPIADLVRDRRSEISGIGECGLDFFYDHSPRDAQAAAFVDQVRLAHAADLALVIHVRDAWDALFDLLEAEGVPPRTVLHCFSGGPAEAERCVAAGMFVSFSGIVSFPKAPEVREAAALVPLEQLLVETDSPFLAPVPFRGRANEPALVARVGEVVAEAKGCAPELVAAASTRNAQLAFGMGGSPH